MLSKLMVRDGIEQRWCLRKVLEESFRKKKEKKKKEMLFAP